MAVITRKQQILAKVQTAEGVPATPGASDAIQVFEPSLSDEVDLLSRVPAGASLSRDYEPVGKKTRQFTFKSDLRGSADTTLPITEPEWGRLGRPCGLRADTAAIVQVPFSSITGAFQLGEVVYSATSANRGVVVGLITGTPAFTHRLPTSGTVIVWVFSGTFASLATVTGEHSGATGAAGTVAPYAGLAYAPDSVKSTTITTASWTGGTPSVGDVLLVKTAGVVVGAIQITVDNGSMLSLDANQLYGTVSNGDTLTNDAGRSCTINSAPACNRTPPLTIWNNLDGRRFPLTDSRGTFSLEGEAGQPLQFSWTFNGTPGTATDVLATTTTGLSAISPPRLFGSTFVAGSGANTAGAAGSGAMANLFRMPLKRFALDLGGQVAASMDANQAGGVGAANVTDRDPVFTITVDQIHGAFDWQSMRDNSTPVRIGLLMGTAAGNCMTIVAANCQVTQVNSADSDGVAVWEVTLKPRRIRESGDDEFLITQI